MRRPPKSRIDFWVPKFEKNVARDQLVTQTLRKGRWRVMRIWECDLASQRQERVVARLPSDQ